MNTKTIRLNEKFGPFLSNGSNARVLCENEIMPTIENGTGIIIDMEGITNMTDSFANVLVANMVEYYGNDFTRFIQFSNCNDTIKTLIKLSYILGKNSKHCTA